MLNAQLSKTKLGHNNSTAHQESNAQDTINGEECMDEQEKSMLYRYRRIHFYKSEFMPIDVQKKRKPISDICLPLDV
jgi:hypothetical protein